MGSIKQKPSCTAILDGPFDVIFYILTYEKIKAKSLLTIPLPLDCWCLYIYLEMRFSMPGCNYVMRIKEWMHYRFDTNTKWSSWNVVEVDKAMRQTCKIYVVAKVGLEIAWHALERSTSLACL
jgi:hypothetical protein